MLQSIIIGHIGADAVVKESNGRKFVSFRVAHSERYKDAQGVQHDTTQWVSCALNGDGGGLLPYLVKGAQVCVIGRTSSRVYSSPTQRQMVASIDVNVDRVELLGGTPDVVPGVLYTTDGKQINVLRLYSVDITTMEQLHPTKANPVELVARSGKRFSLDAAGFITPINSTSDE